MRRLAVCFVVIALAFLPALLFAAEEPSEAAGAGAATFFDMLRLGLTLSRNITVIHALLAFLSLFLFFHIFLSTRARLVVPTDLLRHVLDDVASRDYEAAQKRLDGHASILAQVVLPGLRLHDHPLERIHQAMEGAGRRVIGGLRQEATYLSHVGVLSPMLGLLGTVLGLMKAFNVMGEDVRQGFKFAMMTGAIGQAMSTTAIGLVVGIPAMAGYYLCVSRIGRVADEVEIAAEGAVAAMAEMR